MDILHLFLLLLSVRCMSVVPAQDGINITAEPGQNVNLTCRATKNSNFTVLKLTRDDLDPVYVLFYRNNKIDKTVQNPQFSGRTSLQSLSTADGEVSVTLSNVTKNDSGTYLCIVKDKMYLQTINHLHVAREGDKEEHTEEGENKDDSDGLKGGGLNGLIAGLLAAVLIVTAIIVAAVIVLKKKKRKKTPHNGIENGVQIPLTDQNTSSPS